YILTHLYTVFQDRITTTEARCVLNNLPTVCIISQFPAFFSRVLRIFAPTHQSTQWAGGARLIGKDVYERYLEVFKSRKFD
ncbi:MAG: hypothetical protein IKY72_08460, partial [Bacteroidaceae bacterium]|nr:hypothetical protein [Bacteroidaceae bacterium]